jgi:hypothetical protein
MSRLTDVAHNPLPAASLTQMRKRIDAGEMLLPIESRDLLNEIERLRKVLTVPTDRLHELYYHSAPLWARLSSLKDKLGQFRESYGNLIMKNPEDVDYPAYFDAALMRAREVDAFLGALEAYLHDTTILGTPRGASGEAPGASRRIRGTSGGLPSTP